MVSAVVIVVTVVLVWLCEDTEACDELEVFFFFLLFRFGKFFCGYWFIGLLSFNLFFRRVKKNNAG